MKILLLILLLTPAIAEAHTHAQVIDIIVNAADFVGVPRELPLAICWVESSYRTSLPHRLDGNSPSYGICQIKLETARYIDQVYHHKHAITVKKLQNPSINAIYACKYIKLLLKQYNGSWHKAIDSFNKGHFVSTKSQYVRKVMLAMQEQRHE